MLKVKSQLSKVKGRRRRTGFTIVELLIVIGIIAVLAAAASPIYGNLQISAQLNENISQIIQTTRIAREYSVARLNNASHGVYFEINAGADDRFILYQGDSYAARDADYDRAVSLDSALSLSAAIAGNEVNFSKGLGLPNATGTVAVTHDTKGSRIMLVNDFGMAEEN